MITRFDRIHDCDGRTDIQTPHDSIGRAFIASRGKNQLKAEVKFVRNGKTNKTQTD